MKEFLTEEEYLVHLLRSALRQEQPQELPEGLSFGKVYVLGLQHAVANIAYYSICRLKRKPSEELLREWERHCQMAMTRDINQSFAHEEIVEAFQKAGIRSVDLQGTKLKLFYPQTDYRTMSDLDFIIDPENLNKAWQLLENLGYACEDNNGVEVDAFRAPNINIEVHSEYFPENCEYYSIMRPPFDTYNGSGEIDPNEFYIYHILHIAKHYYRNGCGLRQVMDVYYLDQNGTNLDRSYIRSVMEKANAAEFSENISALAACWFGDGAYREELREMEVYLLGSGVNGTRYNRLDNTLKAMRKENPRFFRIRYSLKRIFVGKDYLYVRYPITKKWKILLPFSWVYRLFSFLTPGGNSRLREEMGLLTERKWKQHK